MEDWNELACSLRKEAAIMSGRNTPANLKELYDLGLAAVCRNSPVIIAFGGLWPSPGDTYELGSLWVAPGHRGERLASRIFGELTAKIPTGQTAFTITHNPRVVHLLEKNAWKRERRATWFDRIPYQASCAPCEDVADSERRDCPGRDDPDRCLLFIYPA